MQQPPSVPFIHHKAGFAWRDRLRAAGIHLGLCVLVASLTALLVFGLWFPWPYRELSGGRDLFLLLVGVDVVVGPLVTFAVFNRAKPMRELRRDLAIVGLLQLSALGYGLWTMAMARPVHLVFEIDRFRVVHRVDIPQEEEAKVPAGLRLDPWTGPTLLAARPFTGEKENYEATVSALEGVQIGARPTFWQPYEAAHDRVLHAARPVAELLKRFPQRKEDIEHALQQAGVAPSEAVYLPVLGRKAMAWTALLDARSAAIVAYLPLDPF